MGSGAYAAHWLGDNHATWEGLRQSVVGILEYGLFGFAFVGVDICGFSGHATPELCRRWHELGAYYPFSRNHHNPYGSQDPAYWATVGHPEVTQAMVRAYRVRYRLLHHLYTLFYRAHVFGDTVARPMHHQFPHDIPSRSVQEQFFLGAAILVNPFLHEVQTQTVFLHNSYSQ